DGPRDRHDILGVLGAKELQKYMVNAVQQVYRLQGVNVNERHLQTIARQMMRWAQADDIGNTEFLPSAIVATVTRRPWHVRSREPTKRRGCSTPAACRRSREKNRWPSKRL